MDSSGSSSTIIANVDHPPTFNPLSLRAWPAKDSGAPPPLSLLIDRIRSQKGDFRNVSEQSLEDEIAALGPSGLVPEESLDSDADEEEEKPKREQLLIVKKELEKLAG